MPNRVIQEGICTSRQMASLSDAAERFWLRLYLGLDDYGCFIWIPAYLRGRCAPLIGWSDERVSELLDELEKAGLIERYTAPSGTFGWLPNFHKYHRLPRARPKYPLPPIHPWLHIAREKIRREHSTKQEQQQMFEANNVDRGGSYCGPDRRSDSRPGSEPQIKNSQIGVGVVDGDGDVDGVGSPTRVVTSCQQMPANARTGKQENTSSFSSNSEIAKKEPENAEVAIGIDAMSAKFNHRNSDHRITPPAQVSQQTSPDDDRDRLPEAPVQGSPDLPPDCPRIGSADLERYKTAYGEEPADVVRALWWAWDEAPGWSNGSTWRDHLNTEAKLRKNLATLLRQWRVAKPRTASVDGRKYKIRVVEC